MWAPKTENDIRDALATGDLTENTRLDMKRAVGDTNGSRAETAKDLASFALYGGALLIGIDEDRATGEFSLAPQPLAGAPEKIEQIAANRVDPPLFVRVSAIPATHNPELGYLFVEIPPSSTAPHMVDGRYYSRGDRTTRRLTDAEVVQHHQRRDDGESRVRSLLREEVARDPWEGLTEREQAHLFLIAEPLVPQRGMLLDVVRSGNNTATFKLLFSAENQLDQRVAQFAPTPQSLAWWVPRAAGLAASSLTEGLRIPSHDTDEASSLDIEIQEDGGIRLFCGRLSDNWGKYSNRPAQKVLMDGLALAYTLRLIRWTQEAAAHGSYRGPWGFGIACTGVRGLVSHALVDSFGERTHPYDRDSYEQVTTASLQEIEDAPGAVANRLVGQFLRGVGSANRYADLLD